MAGPPPPPPMFGLTADTQDDLHAFAARLGIPRDPGTPVGPQQELVTRHYLLTEGRAGHGVQAHRVSAGPLAGGQCSSPRRASARRRPLRARRPDRAARTQRGVTAAVTVISTFAAGRGDDAAALVRVHGRHPGRDRPGGARRNRRAARRAPVRVPRPARRLQPAGALLLVGNGTQSTGCVGLAPCTDERTAEVKRLYVRPAWRGNGVGYTEGDLPLDGGLVV